MVILKIVHRTKLVWLKWFSDFEPTWHCYYHYLFFLVDVEFFAPLLIIFASGYSWITRYIEKTKLNQRVHVLLVCFFLFVVWSFGWISVLRVVCIGSPIAVFIYWCAVYGYAIFVKMRCRQAAAAAASLLIWAAHKPHRRFNRIFFSHSFPFASIAISIFHLSKWTENDRNALFAYRVCCGFVTLFVTQTDTKSAWLHRQPQSNCTMAMCPINFKWTCIDWIMEIAIDRFTLLCTFSGEKFFKLNHSINFQ